MKLRTRLTIRYTGITAAVFLIVMAVIYGVNEHARSEAFFRRLRSEAITKAHLFLNNRMDAGTMQSVYLNNKQFIDEVEVAVYGTDEQILYHDALQNDIIKETPAMLQKILKEHELNFYVGDYQGIGILYEFNGKPYLVTAAAYDRYGYAAERTLNLLLGILLICGVTLLAVIGYLLARGSLAPIRGIVRQAQTITATDFDKRLPEGERDDELGELSRVLNDLLDRIGKSMQAQKMFVSNVSHELRTPMAALTAELDLALQKERTTAQYRQSISNALQDASGVVRLTDGLLNLAKADYQPEHIKTEELRLDELLINANDLIMRAHPDYHVELIFEQEADDDNVLTVVANPYLLTTAFVNLIENNCKYSANKTSFIQISFWEQNTIIRLSDNGIGMSETDKQNLFRLFYRGENQEYVKGHGIGMTLTQKIITLFRGEISVYSHLGQGTTFVVRLPHV